MQELHDLTKLTKMTPYWCRAMFHVAICNLKTHLLPFIVKKKTHECSLKIQPASNRCSCSPDDPLRYSSASTRDTHVVTLAGDLWPRRIIGPTWSAAWDIHYVVKCTAQNYAYQSSEIIYVCVREEAAASVVPQGGMWVSIFFSLRTKAHPC